MTSTEAVIYQGNVQTADCVTTAIHHYMTHWLQEKGKFTTWQNFNINSSDVW
jgi:hypothetical protein